MLSFPMFAATVARHFQTMLPTGLYRIAIDADEAAVTTEEQRPPSLLWSTYLQSFPAGSNPLYRTRTEYDCSACRHFLRQMGNVVTIRENAIVTLWDFEVDRPYQPEIGRASV